MVLFSYLLSVSFFTVACGFVMSLVVCMVAFALVRWLVVLGGLWFCYSGLFQFLCLLHIITHDYF